MGGEAPHKRLPSLEGTPWASLKLDRDIVDIPTLLADAARRWPDRTAWHFTESGHEVRYAELAEQVERLAGALQKLGVAKGTRVGIMLRNVPEFPLGWLALAVLHAVSIPLNPIYTPRELAFILEDTALSHLVISDDLLATFDEAVREHGPVGADASNVIVVGRDRDGYGPSFSSLLASDTLRAELPETTDPDALATILFTSGTTGLPKGCMLTQTYWTLLARVTCALVGDVRNILADHPFYYLQNQFYLMVGLACGARNVVTPGLSLSTYVDKLWDFDIDFAWISHRLLKQPPSDRDRGHELLRAPADQLVPATHAELEQRFGVVVREWYGSTEAGTGTLVPWDDHAKTGSGSIGIAGPFRETKIVDDTFEEVPCGEIGELCIRGPGMMTGYFNRPDTNREQFLEGGWFRTGDLCTKGSDGHHYFKGRLKDVIRRSGEQIAAQEVEHVLSGMPGVMKVAVIPVPDERRGEEVKAYIVADAAHQASLTPEHIFDWCRSRLAGFKVPRYLEFRSDLPLTSSGKIAKALLRSEKADLRTGSYDAVAGGLFSG